MERIDRGDFVSNACVYPRSRGPITKRGLERVLNFIRVSKNVHFFFFFFLQVDRLYFNFLGRYRGGGEGEARRVPR